MSHRQDFFDHELAHMFAAAAAVVHLEPGIYGMSRVHIYASETGGGFALEMPERMCASTRRKISGLSAIGPTALSDFDLVQLFRSGSDCVIRAAGNLSARDWQLFERWHGPRTTPALISLAARKIYRSLDLGRLERIRAAQRHHQKRRLEPLPLAVWLPEPVAYRALADALAALQAAPEPLAPFAGTGTPGASRVLK